MCRIFGMSMGEEKEDLDAVEIAGVLFPALIHNGPHAYGWMSYNDEDDEGGIIFDKRPGRADTDKAWNIINAEMDPYPRWMVGHLRYATHGSPKDNRNNHPMTHGKIIGVHNGVLRNHEEILAITGRDDDETQVDSEAIFAAVNKWGPKRGLAKIRGDMVTIYANRDRPRTLHIGRSSGRQLTIGWTERGNIIFASEQQALERLAPEITFRKFSTISENRLLVLRDGKIVSRVRYAPPRPKYVAPPASVDISDRFHFSQERAARRGQLIFGKDRGRGDRKPLNWAPDEIVMGDGKPAPPEGLNNLYYHNGELLTFEEYQLVVEENGF